MAKAAAQGHRVVLVTATRGEHGDAHLPDGLLEPGETLSQRRVRELEAAADILGVARLEFLGYTDSGMMGEPQNDQPGSFWRADVDEAASRLAALLEEEHADALTVYDDHGGYGHPDHIQVHRVGVRAAALAATPRVYEATMNRDFLQEMMRRARESGLMEAVEEAGVEGPPEPSTFGTPAALINTTVDVRPYVDQKRRAIVVHASQIPEDSFFTAMPPEIFAEVFGQEWFIRRDVPDDWRATELLP
jgi:LmbE family N-acetylglucosaminyl deacetylase